MNLPSGPGQGPFRGTVSLCMIVRDEESTLQRCLESARPFSDEIVVVDTGSKDATPRIARAAGARVVSFPWIQDFSAARNAALEPATSDWILVLDADEVLQVEDPEAFRTALQDPGKAGFVLRLLNLRDEGEPVSSLVLRCFRNHPEVRFEGILHERVDDSLDRIALASGWTLGHLPALIEHRGYLEEVVRSRQKEARDRELLEKTIATGEEDPYLLYKVAVHPLNYPDRPETVERCLTRAWNVLRSRNRHACRRQLFAPEVPAILALMLARRGARDEADALLAEGLERCGPSPNLHFVRALVRQSLGLHEEAIASFDEALGYHGAVLAYAPLEGATSFAAWNGRSESLMALGRDDEAHRARALAGSSGADPSHAFLTPVADLAREGEAARAFKMVAARVGRMPWDRGTWERGKELLEALGRPDAARAWAERFRSRGPGGAMTSRRRPAPRPR